MCSNSSSFRIPIVRGRAWILNSFEVLVVSMRLVDVRLHHLVLLINYGAWTWHDNALVSFLARFTDSLECWVLVCRHTSHVSLHCIHSRLRTSDRSIRPVSHLVLCSSKLGTFGQVILLLSIDLEAIGRLEWLRLALRPAGHCGARSVSRNLSLCLIR